MEGGGGLECETSRENELRCRRERGLEARCRLRPWRTLLRIEDLGAVNGLLRLVQQLHIAPRGRDRRVGRSHELAGESVGQVVARRQLAQLRESGVEKAERRAAHRSLIRRKDRIDQTRYRVRHRRVLEVLVVRLDRAFLVSHARLEVDEGGEPQVLQKSECVGHTAQPCRRRLPVVEKWRAGARHRTAGTVVAQDVLQRARWRVVRAHDLLPEEGADRITLAVVLVDRIPAVRYAHWRQSAETLDTVVGGCEVDAQIPRQLRDVDYSRIYADLASPRRHSAEVHDGGARESDRWAVQRTDDGVLGRAIVVREGGSDPVVEEADVESCLELLTALRPERRIAQRSGRKNGDAPRSCGRRIKRDRVEDIRLLTGLSPCGAQAEGVHARHVPERFLTKYPGRTHLRVIGRLVVFSERAVRVASDGGREGAAILPAECLLQVHAERLILRDVFARCR